LKKSKYIKRKVYIIILAFTLSLIIVAKLKVLLSSLTITLILLGVLPFSAIDFILANGLFKF
jgi:hypothetical protein